MHSWNKKHEKNVCKVEGEELYTHHIELMMTICEVYSHSFYISSAFFI